MIGVAQKNRIYKWSVVLFFIVFFFFTFVITTDISSAKTKDISDDEDYEILITYPDTIVAGSEFDIKAICKNNETGEVIDSGAGDIKFNWSIEDDLVDSATPAEDSSICHVKLNNNVYWEHYDSCEVWIRLSIYDGYEFLCSGTHILEIYDKKYEVSFRDYNNPNKIYSLDDFSGLAPGESVKAYPIVKYYAPGSSQGVEDGSKAYFDSGVVYEYGTGMRVSLSDGVATITRKSPDWGAIGIIIKKNGREVDYILNEYESTTLSVRFSKGMPEYGDTKDGCVLRLDTSDISQYSSDMVGVVWDVCESITSTEFDPIEELVQGKDYTIVDKTKDGGFCEIQFTGKQIEKIYDMGIEYVGVIATPVFKEHLDWNENENYETCFEDAWADFAIVEATESPFTNKYVLPGEKCEFSNIEFHLINAAFPYGTNAKISDLVLEIEDDSIAEVEGKYADGTLAIKGKTEGTCKVTVKYDFEYTYMMMPTIVKDQEETFILHVSDITYKMNLRNNADSSFEGNVLSETDFTLTADLIQKNRNGVSKKYPDGVDAAFVWKKISNVDWNCIEVTPNTGDGNTCGVKILKKPEYPEVFEIGVTAYGLDNEGNIDRAEVLAKDSFQFKVVDEYFTVEADNINADLESYKSGMQISPIVYKHTAEGKSKVEDIAVDNLYFAYEPGGDNRDNPASVDEIGKVTVTGPISLEDFPWNDTVILLLKKGNVVLDKKTIGVSVCEKHEFECVNSDNCEEGSKDVYTCRNCGYSYKEEATGHSCDWRVAIKATPDKNGLMVGICEKCNGIEIKEIISPKPVLSRTSYEYDSCAHCPSLTVISGDEVVGEANYISDWSNKRSKSVGKYNVKVTLQGKYYSGSKTVSYTINPKGTSISKLTGAKGAFTVMWKKQTEPMSTSRITGYQVRYSTKSSMSGAKTSTVSGYSKYSKKISKLKAKKKYYVQVRTYKTVSGEKYYSSWSAKKYVMTK